MARVTPLPSSVLSADQAALYERFASGYANFRGQAATLAHVPPALDGLYSMLLALRAHANLPLRYVELTVVTVSKLNACPYCVAHHEPLLAVEGVPEDAIAALPGFDHPAFDASDRLVIEYAGLVTQRAWGIRDDVFERLRGCFSQSQIVELTLRISLAGFFNRFNDALQVDDDLPPSSSPSGKETPDE
ncbi:carboxymuconolactone decarboxylase family protein [Ancylobacter rudongensis]|uniref:Alkylhydroperoxidase AhpD family core domain-containing protein n=1 Tax=Ancylobacter rudongensis TaxID=177413 RepID=A0A1G4SCB0_9HYPH|nr:carboxymuconolactone decarboxylase family protein [Ancylobacter rudongensis]SCW66668.1 alkylhydroperoxidase AhpD family core domain-containing protein [Ancylobacter rudongensis]